MTVDFYRLEAGISSHGQTRYALALVFIHAGLQQYAHTTPCKHKENTKSKRMMFILMVKCYVACQDCEFFRRFSVLAIA